MGPHRSVLNIGYAEQLIQDLTGLRLPDHGVFCTPELDVGDLPINSQSPSDGPHVSLTLHLDCKGRRGPREQKYRNQGPNPKVSLLLYVQYEGKAGLPSVTC
jgi:hypothetical protein